MAKFYRATYKCRHCGATFYDAGTGNEDIVRNCMVALTVGTKPPHPQAPQMTTIHLCKDPYEGCIGLADFTGWECLKEG